MNRVYLNALIPPESVNFLCMCRVVKGPHRCAEEEVLGLREYRARVQLTIPMNRYIQNMGTQTRGTESRKNGSSYLLT